MFDTSHIIEPHKNQPVLIEGAPLKDAEVVMIMLHGRGATADSMLSLVNEFAQPNVAYIIPQAKQNTWYPYRFIEERRKNEPGITSGMQMIDYLIDETKKHGFVEKEIILLGFSQGACLALDYAARNPQKYGGVIGLSGGLIGKQLDYKDFSGNLEHTPIFLGCSDVDFHIPIDRVHETKKIFKLLNGSVTLKIYPDMDHTINKDEIEHVIKIIHGTVTKK